MEESISFTPRPSAIPRLSKLPLPRATLSQSVRASSPTKSFLARAVSPTHACSSSTLDAVYLGEGFKKPPSTPQTALRLGLKQSTTQSNIAASRTAKRPPLGQAKSLQTKPSPEALLYSTKDDAGVVERPKIMRDVSQQENATYNLKENDTSSGELFDELRTPGSIRLPRKARPSLSERTIESLALLPPSPAPSRKGPNIFTPQKPVMTRLPSLLASSTTSRPKIEPSIRAMSPLKRSIVSTPLKQTALPRVAALKPKAASTQNDSVTAAIVRPSSAASNLRASTTSTIRNKTLGARPATISRPSLDNIFQTPQPRKMEGRTVTARAAVDTNAIASQAIPSTSATLREKIAQARAAQRNAVRKPDSAIALSPTSDDFEICPGSAHAGLQNASLLVNRVDAARKDGRLNIAALGLKHIPDEVLAMYDSASMENSSVSWYEAVDLTRFIGADNEIEGIGDGVFPDASKEALAMEVDSKGNLFGGLEFLDLHGNLLQQVPIGLRRLEQLTVLNLSRNKLDNSAFDVITQIPSLRELRLADNELSREVPETIGSLVSLEVLDVHGNRLSHLPTSLRQLTHLRQLDVSKNRFTALPMDILASLPLSELFASHNALFAALFSPGVIAFPRLQVLEVANNALAALSFESTLQFPSLQRLDVSNNRLNTLPDMSEWTALSVLLAEENDLQCLPDGFASLMGMRNASFRCNSIRLVDLEVAHMESLEVLSLEGNPLRDRKYLVMSVEEMKRDLQKKLEVEKDMF